MRVNGEGNGVHCAKSSKTLVGGSASTRLVYQGHRIELKDGNQTLVVDLVDAQTGIQVANHICLVGNLPIFRSWSIVENIGQTTHVINHISSLTIGGLDAPESTWWNDYEMSICRNAWFREAQWQSSSLPDLGLDDHGIDYPGGPSAKESHAYYSVSNRSTFTTAGHLPMGMLRSSSDLWLWQIENNGAWRWDVGDYDGHLFLGTCGPESNDHDWRLRLQPGETYQTPATAVHRGRGDLDRAFGAMNAYRRRLVRPHRDHKELPIIFNDYMNCLNGDPTEEKILALLDPVKRSGAEYFVIDAGWYSDDSDWWEDVGAWEPSKKRFPSGFDRLLAQIEAAGLKPGLWIEPEVMGVRCDAVQDLPHEAFLQRDGHRMTERGRYHLDFRHPLVRARLDKIIDRCVLSHGAKYFKFDYNIEHVLGTDIDCSSPGVGQAMHSQAYLAWVSSLLDRYPDLVMENCSSGGLRMDYGMLATHTLQSTSDQQDPVLYAAISAALPTAVLPQQGASWAYPQPSWSDEINALTVANSLFGRVHLSGRLDLLSPHQLEDIVYEGMRVYKNIRREIMSASPFWPIDLPRWHDKWLALGMAVSDTALYLLVWKRNGPSVKEFPLPAWSKTGEVSVELVYPKSFATKAPAKWIKEKNSLRVELEAHTCARLYHVQVK